MPPISLLNYQGGRKPRGNKKVLSSLAIIARTMCIGLPFRDHIHVEDVALPEVVPALGLEEIRDKAPLYPLCVLIGEGHLVEQL